MTNEILLCTTDERGVATLTLNRAEVHNAFDNELIAALTEAVRRLMDKADVRVVVLAAAGKSFCAGADLTWMRRMADATQTENEADARRFAELLHAIATLPRPVVAKVQGPAYAGGLAFIAAADIAVAARQATFGVTEVRLGLVPSTLAPYVLAAIGPRAARRYFLTAERFDAEEAMRIGLIHGVVEREDLDTAVDRIVDALLLNGPEAVAECKTLLHEIAGDVDEEIRTRTARVMARARAGAEGREGIAAFLEKREPAWRASARVS